MLAMWNQFKTIIYKPIILLIDYLFKIRRTYQS